MNILDENIPMLQQQRRPTFFTRDEDFFVRELCHPRYCLVYLTVAKAEVALFVRRLLRQPAFRTQASRMGKVLRISHAGISFLQRHQLKERYIEWK